MNTTTTVVLSAFLGAATSAIVATQMAQNAASAEEVVALTPGAPSVVSEGFAELRERQTGLERALEELQMQVASQSSGRVSRGDIDDAVQRFLEQSAGAAAPEEASASSLAKATLALEDVIAEIQAGDMSDTDRQRLWKRLNEEGRAEEVVDWFKAQVDDDPNDPDKRVDLGRVYLEQIQAAGNGPLAGVYATQADEQFDRALEMQPEHWEARFTKAIALSFWPPVFGKQGAAIQQFEILAGQQDGQTAAPQHAETHLLLGNMYQQTGQPEKALAAWQKGAQIFPNHPGLQAQLALLSQH